MPIRIPWDRYEIALLFHAYEHVMDGADINKEATELSSVLRQLAIRRNIAIDDTYRNVNGMKMQLANVQYLFTDGQKGLSGASAMIRQMFELYKANYAEYQTILKEAIELTGETMSVENAFFAYAKECTELPPRMLSEYLQKAAGYCHLKQPLLGMTDVKTVRNVQQKVAEGKLLRFRFGKDTQAIRNVTQLYYTFIKKYREAKEESPVQKTLAEEKTALKPTTLVMDTTVVGPASKHQIGVVTDASEGHAFESDFTIGHEAAKDLPKRSEPIVLPGRSINLSELDGFRSFLLQEQRLAERTAENYQASIRKIEEYIQQNALPYSLVNATASDVQSVVDMLMSRPDFIRINDERHHQYSAAMAQYVSFLGKMTQTTESVGNLIQPTPSGVVKDTVVQAEENDSMLAEKRERILSIVSETFPHGIRPLSIIDINKLRRVYQAKFDEELSAEVDLVSLLTSIGLKGGEKVYFLSEDQKQSLRSLITGIVEDGHRVIYYSELLSLHGELFESCHIYESLLMRTVLKSILPAYFYKAEWMRADRGATEIEEITRAFGEDIVLTYQQLKCRCPYLTLDAIKWALSRSERFVWSSPETYAQVDLIELDQAEVDDIVHRILPLIQEVGYFSLAQLPIEESCGMNPQVSFSAVRDCIYNRYMAGRFSRNGLIVKRPEIHLTTYQLMEIWLKGLEQVTLAEVEEYERELTGHHAVLGIAAAGNTMVRIDHDHYVSDASIQFDVEAVDRAITLFAENRIIPISAITSFTSFPEVPGYSWNLYLVESFLRRFSKRFTIDGGPAQMSYVGGICSADRSFENYEDRLAHAVIQDGTVLTEDAIGRYLTERKFILRRSETVRKTLERARILNEQRGESSVRI